MHLVQLSSPRLFRGPEFETSTSQYHPLTLYLCPRDATLCAKLFLENIKIYIVFLSLIDIEMTSISSHSPYNIGKYFPTIGVKRPILQITHTQCAYRTPQNTPFRTEMYTFLF